MADLSYPTTSTSTDIIFYDISFRRPYSSSACAPNPWKSRYALNFKALSYSTCWVPMLEISKVRQSVGAPACRQFADGSDFYTLPMLTDKSTDAIVGDSFDIAMYLQKAYPDSGAGDLFPAQTLDFGFSTDNIALAIPLTKHDEEEGTVGQYVRFNAHIDTLFTTHVLLMAHGFPFDPENAEMTKAEFVRRAGLKSWDDLGIAGEAREKLKESLRESLAPLAGLLKRNERGPFFLGEKASYADLIVGGWLKMMHVTLPEKEWEEVKGWHGGAYGQLHTALEKFAVVK